MRSGVFKPATISDIQREKAFNTNQLIALMVDVHPVMQADVQKNGRHVWECMRKISFQTS